MQAVLEGRRTTQLWTNTDTGTRSLGANDSLLGVTVLFPDSPPSFERNVGCAHGMRSVQMTVTAMPGHSEWPGPASEGTLEL